MPLAAVHPAFTSLTVAEAAKLEYLFEYFHIAIEQAGADGVHARPLSARAPRLG
jgi:hypothetical protein